MSAVAMNMPQASRTPAPAATQAVAPGTSAPAEPAAAPFLDTLRRELGEAAQLPAETTAPTPEPVSVPSLADSTLQMQLAQAMTTSAAKPAASDAATTQTEKETKPDVADVSALLPLLHNLMAPLMHANVAAQLANAGQAPTDASVDSVGADTPAARNPASAAAKLALQTDSGLASANGGDRSAPSVPSLDATLASLARATAVEQPATRAQDAVVKLPSDSSQWRQPLTQALGDRLEVMRSRGSDTAVIRLDPPMMGRIDIQIRHEAGALKVSISATHGEVLRQLQGIGESLRADLSQRQFGDVTVQVTDSAASRFSQGDSEGGRRQSQSEQQEPGRALAEAESGHEPGGFRLAGDQE
jgi:flagellar hook-length control protein FliK